MPKPRPKKQHYVPQLHLRQFVSDQPKGMVWTYDMRRETCRPSHPRETGADTNFYSPSLPDGTRFDGLEKWLADVESKAVPGYEALLNGRIPEGQALADFSTFVASLHVRSPSAIKAAAHLQGQMFQAISDPALSSRTNFESMMDRMERDKGPIGMSRDEVWEFMRDRDRYYIEIDQQRGLMAMGASDRIQEILFHRSWYILEATEGYFITSDSPVSRDTPPDKHYGLYGDGAFINPAAEITLPLSPSRMLMITGTRVEHHHLPVFREQVDALNARRAGSADNFLYAHVRDAAVANLARDFRDVHRTATVSGGPYAEVKVVRGSREVER